MPYKFQQGKIYRMPTHFGPTPGPRQGAPGHTLFSADGPLTTLFSVSFLTDREQLAELLPEGFKVGETPVVTVTAAYMTDIPWLAGRGYNTLGVTFPAAFHGERDRVDGDFLAVLWENFPDAIVSGREELGFSKLYCELPAPSVAGGDTWCTASWFGFRFMDMHVRDPRPATSEDLAVLGERKSEGFLHYKYIPTTARWGEADAAYAVMTPYADPYRKVKEAWIAEGSVEFHEAAWEQLPTQYNVVNGLRRLEIRSFLAAGIVKTVGSKDLSDQRVLR